MGRTIWRSRVRYDLETGAVLHAWLRCYGWAWLVAEPWLGADCCPNHQLMSRTHRQNRRSLYPGHEARRVAISCSAKLKFSPAIHHAIIPSTAAALVASPSSKISCKVMSTSSQVASAENNEKNSETPKFF